MALTNLKAPAVTGNLKADLATDASNLDPLGLNKGSGLAGPLPSLGNITGQPLPPLDPEKAFNDLLQQIYDKIKADGEVIIKDMQKAQAIAATKLPDGSIADQPSSDCLSAFIPVVQLIVDNQIVPPGVTPTPPIAGTPAPTPDGVVTTFVKIRVVLNALTSPSVTSGCAWLQQSIQGAGTQGIAGVLGAVLGITKVAGVLGIA